MLLFALAMFARLFYLDVVVQKEYSQNAQASHTVGLTVEPRRGTIYDRNGKILAVSVDCTTVYCNPSEVTDPTAEAAVIAKYLGGTYKDYVDKLSAEKSTFSYVKRKVDKDKAAELKKEGLDGIYFLSDTRREYPYGEVGGQLVGATNVEVDQAANREYYVGISGLEYWYNETLSGTAGYYEAELGADGTPIPGGVHESTAAVDGKDIVISVDIELQQTAEAALKDRLERMGVKGGTALVVDGGTGEIYACASYPYFNPADRTEVKEGSMEVKAISSLLEPGSVFKPASILVALDDGVVDTTYHVETGGGIWPMYGREMKDHNWRKGGYGMLTLAQTLWYSSNIGVSRIIDDHYRNNPEKFVKGIYRTGLHDDLKIPLVGATPARIRMPHRNKNGQYDNWAKTSLPWMSIGYETQIPPISTLTFYNTIANNGKMMRPRFVSKVMKNGETIMEFPPEVMRQQIAKEKSIKELQTILEQVVSVGLGKKAGSPNFKVAGKTGTAQISKGAGGYKSGGTSYLISFAGYFPADAPRYSCIVCIQKSGLPASGGTMCGKVFHEISEGIMAQSLKVDVKDARDSASVFVPDVKAGNILAANYVLSHLGIKTNANWSGSYADGNPIWGKAERVGNHSIKLIREKQYGKTIVPDVTGMGARDAIYNMESRGIKTQITGRGKVVKQSLMPGTVIKKGAVCSIVLE